MGMNEKSQKIDELLQYLADLQRQNPNHIFTEREVYYHLVRQDVPAEERSYPVNRFFDDFVQNFKDYENLNVFVDPNWNYFCQFISQKPNEVMAYNPNHIKLYIPLDARHIYRGVDQIFNFLSENDISHVSKVGSAIRNDDIVIRLEKPEDAQKLIHYVQNSSYLQEGLLPASPFLHQEGGVAMTCDGSLSFSNSLSCMISEYIQEKQMNHQLNQVGAHDFYSFVDSLYRDLYISQEADFNAIHQHFPSVVNQKCISDLKGIFEIIHESKRADFSFDDYISIYQKACNPKENLSQIEQSYHEQEQIDLSELLQKGIDIMTQRLGSKEKAIYTIQTYLDTGNHNLITRTDDLRTIYQTSHFRNRLQDYLNEHQLPLEQYVFEIEEKQEKPHVENAAKKMRLVMDIMGSKYGEDVALATVTEYLKTGNPQYLTKEYGIRTAIGKSDVRDQINLYINSQNLSAEEFLNDISANRTPEQYFEDACAITYSKYQTLYENKESEISGEQWLNYAVGSYVQSGEANGFTRDFNARFHIQSHVTPENAKQAIAQKLEANVSDLNPSYGSLVTLCKEYAKAIADESFIRN